MVTRRRGRGEGSMSKQPNGRWKAYVTIDGKRLFHSAATKLECQEWIRNTLHQMDTGLSIVGSRLKLSEFLKQWLEDRSKNLRLSTFHDYKHYCENDIIRCIGSTTLKDLKLAGINAFYANLFDSGRGEATIRYIHRILHSSLSDAIKLGYIGYNPSDHANLPSKSGHRSMIEMKAKEHLKTDEDGDDETIPDEMKVLTEAQLSQFIMAAMGSSYYALFVTASITGMRAGELLGLKWKDTLINDDHAIISVRRQVRRTPHIGMLFSPVKTKASLRTIKVGSNTARILKEQITRLETTKATAGKRWQDYNLVFPSSLGTPLEISNLRREFNRVIKRAGVPKINFHGLRHTAASIMLSHKIPVVIVSRILGHSRPSTTIDIYYHFIPATNDEAVKLMDDLNPIAVEIESLLTIDDESRILAEKET